MEYRFMEYNRRMKRIVLAALTAACCTLPVAAADISGTWNLTGDVVGNPVILRCVFTQTGAKVSGSCAGDAGNTPTSGEVADNKVTFGHSVQGYDLTYNGTLDAAGTSLRGEIQVAGVSGTFSATKEAAAPKAADAGPDFAGNWTIDGEVVGNIIHMKCGFKRDGDKVSGTCAYEGLGNSATTGSVAGSKVTLQNQVQREQLYDLTYNGTLDAAGAAIKGDIAVAGVTGTFSGTKDK